MLPLDRFCSFVTKYDLFDSNSKILLAVSGGRDSVLMAHLFNASGYTFGIAHCNFKLRAEESDEDENFVRELAKQLNAPFYTKHFNTEANSQESHISIQMAARDLRYTWLEKIREDYNYDSIALAHHKNDVVETVLLNLVRGTGIAGMHGILPKRGYLVRPLLFLNREEIDELIDKEGILYREDSSNLSDKYARNKIRLEVIPKLKELNPSLEKTFEENSRRFAELEEYFNGQVNVLRKKLFKKQASGGYIIELEHIRDIEPQGTLLFELFRPFNFADNVLEDLAASWEGHSGKIFESSTHSIILDRGKLILIDRKKELIKDSLVFENDELVLWGDHAFNLKSAAVSDFRLNESSNQLYVDADLLTFPLKFRSWKKGDIFYPAGMEGKKKLSDFFINKKVPLNEKQLIPILENGNGDIIWIAGYRSDKRYKITSQSKKVAIFELQE